jgi:hypothetical protein
MITCGIDPGLTNTGIAVMSGRELVFSETLKVRGLTIHEVKTYFEVLQNKYEIERTGVERFASYRGVTSSDTENLLMFIGILISYMPSPQLVRAIDWKVQLSHKLYVEGFRNKAKSLDKTFSKDAAEFLLGKKLKSHHECDAVLLGYWRSLQEDASIKL